jgi:hypothetical protein
MTRLVMAYADDLSAGLAGEHLVCADLLREGFAAFRAEQNCAYDVGVDLGDRLIRLQVKATRLARPFLQKGQTYITGYSWGIRQGKRGVRAYAVGAVDGFALVALDSGQIAYLRPEQGRQTFQIPISGAKSNRGKRFEEFAFDGLL